MAGKIKEDLQDHSSLHPRMISFHTLRAFEPPYFHILQATYTELRSRRTWGWWKSFSSVFRTDVTPDDVMRGSLAGIYLQFKSASHVSNLFHIA
jgi:hypothetical protein